MAYNILLEKLRNINVNYIYIENCIVPLIALPELDYLSQSKLLTYANIIVGIGEREYVYNVMDNVLSKGDFKNIYRLEGFLFHAIDFLDNNYLIRADGTEIHGCNFNTIRPLGISSYLLEIKDYLVIYNSYMGVSMHVDDVGILEDKSNGTTLVYYKKDGVWKELSDSILNIYSVKGEQLRVNTEFIIRDNMTKTK